MSDQLQHSRGLPTELLTCILCDTILENIHHRLTHESGEDLNWNSLVVLQQVCHVFRDICLELCEKILGDPTPEQEAPEGQWHAKSCLQHTLDALEHLSSFSPSHLASLPDEDPGLNEFQDALLNEDYRASFFCLPGLLGMYQAALVSRLVSTRAFKPGHTEETITVNLLLFIGPCLDSMRSRVFPASRCGKFTSPQLIHFTSELHAQYYIDEKRIQLFLTARYLNDFISQKFALGPMAMEFIQRTIRTLRITLRSSGDIVKMLKRTNDLGLHFNSSVTFMLDRSTIIPTLERLSTWARDELVDPLGSEIKPLTDELLGKLTTLLHGDNQSLFGMAQV